MLRLWRLFRGGLSYSSLPPDAGGALDQPAVMIEAFDAMSAAADHILEERRRSGDRS